MPEAFTLAAIGTVVLTEGVKFLYGQATELLKLWRSRETGSETAEETVATDTVLPAEVFEDKSDTPLEVHLGALARLAPELRDLRTHLSDYADGIEPIAAADEDLLASLDAVRRMLEAVYDRPLTLKGEERDDAEIVVKGSVDVETLRGHAAGVRSRLAAKGKITGTAKAGTAEAGSEIYGVEVDQVGD